MAGDRTTLDSEVRADIEETLRSILGDRREVLGSDHADTLITMWSLGALLAADCLPRPLGFVFILFLLPELLLLPLLPLLPLCLCACVRADTLRVWMWLWR